MKSLDTTINEDLKTTRNHSKPYNNYEELYGKLSCELHSLAKDILDDKDITEDIVDIIVQCCYALECLSDAYDPFADKEKQQTRDQIQLTETKNILKQILELYKNTTLEKAIQKGQPPRRLVYLPPELVNDIFSLFN